ncbi:hypothetical protein DMA11_17990, partial [Marinilabiliaceae bacterium JC017]
MRFISVLFVFFLTMMFSLSTLRANPVFHTQAETKVANHSEYKYYFSASGLSESSNIQYFVFNKPSWLKLTLYGDGSGLLHGTPQDKDYGDYTFYLDAREGNSYTRQTIRLEVTNENPVFDQVPPVTAINYNEYTYSFRVTDADEGDKITFSTYNLPRWLKLVDNGNGTGMLYGKPEGSDYGDYTFYLDARDGVGYTRQTIRLEVVNNPPEFDSEPKLKINNHFDYYYQVAASDPDQRGNFHFEVFNEPAWMTLKPSSDGSSILSGTPGDADYGDYTFYLDVRDANSYTRQTMRFEVDNAPPLFDTQPVLQAINHQYYTYNFKVTDPDRCDNIHFELFNQPSWLKMKDNLDGTGQLYGTPGDADYGDYTFYLDARDGVTCTRQVIRLEVVNTAPVFVQQPVVEAPVGATYRYNFAVTDPDIGDVVTYSVYNKPSWLSLDAVNGVISGTPTQEDAGDYTFYLDARDGVSYARQVIRIEVTGNPLYFTSKPPIKVRANQPYSYAFAVNDLQTSSFTKLAGPDWLVIGNVTNGTGIISGTPEDGDLLTPQVVIIEAQSGGEKAIQQFALSRSGSNMPPYFGNSFIPVVTVNKHTSFAITAFDAEGDNLSVTNNNNDLPRGLSLGTTNNVNGGASAIISGKLSLVGEYSFTLELSDETNTKSQIFKVVCEDNNTLPIIDSGGDRTINLGDNYSYTIVANDLDGDDVTISFLGDLPPGLSLGETVNTGCGSHALLSGIITKPGVYTIPIVVDDHISPPSTKESITITVIDPNGCPFFTNQAEITLLREKYFEFQLVTFDSGGDEMTITNVTSLPKGVKLDLTENVSSGKATALLKGAIKTGESYEITFQVTDGTNVSEQVFTIKLRSAPVFDSDPITYIAPGEQYYYPVVMSDADLDHLEVSFVDDLPWNLKLININNLEAGKATAELTGVINDEGTYWVRLAVFDGTYPPTEQVFTIQVVNCSIRPEEIEVLSEIKNTNGGTLTRQWDLSKNPNVCSWPGIETDGEHITGILLPNDGLTGVLPESLCTLPSLTHVDFTGNALETPYPSCLCNLISKFPSVSLMKEGTGLICSGGTVRLVAELDNPGSAGYVYKWYNPDNNLIKEGDEAFVELVDLTSAALGEYRVEVSYSEGGDCGQSATLELTPAVFYPAPDITITDILPTTCAWSTDGQACISITGADGSYSYTISNAQGNPVEQVTNVSSGTGFMRKELGVGKYTLSGKTAHGCPFSRTFTIQNGGPVLSGVCVPNIPCGMEPYHIREVNVTFTVNRLRQNGNPNYTYNVYDSEGIPIFSQDIEGEYGKEIVSPVFQFSTSNHYGLVIYSADNCSTGQTLEFQPLHPSFSGMKTVYTRCFPNQKLTVKGHVNLGEN